MSNPFDSFILIGFSSDRRDDTTCCCSNLRGATAPEVTGTAVQRRVTISQQAAVVAEAQVAAGLS